MQYWCSIVKTANSQRKNILEKNKILLALDVYKMIKQYKYPELKIEL